MYIYTPQRREMNHLLTAVEEKKKESSIFLTYMREEKNVENIWYLDSGVNNYMCDQKEFFNDMEASIRGDVSFGDLSKTSLKEKE